MVPLGKMRPGSWRGSRYAGRNRFSCSPEFITLTNPAPALCPAAALVTPTARSGSSQSMLSGLRKQNQPDLRIRAARRRIRTRRTTPETRTRVILTRFRGGFQSPVGLSYSPSCAEPRLCRQISGRSSPGILSKAQFILWSQKYSLRIALLPTLHNLKKILIKIHQKSKSKLCFKNSEPEVCRLLFGKMLVRCNNDRKTIVLSRLSIIVCTARAYV